MNMDLPVVRCTWSDRTACKPVPSALSIVRCPRKLYRSLNQYVCDDCEWWQWCVERLGDTTALHSPHVGSRMGQKTALYSDIPLRLTGVGGVCMWIKMKWGCRTRAVSGLCSACYRVSGGYTRACSEVLRENLSCSFVCVAGRSTGWQKVKVWTLYVNFSTTYFHTFHAYKHN